MSQKSGFAWGASASILIIAGTAAWLTISGTVPAMKARAAAEAKNAQLKERKAALEEEITDLRSEITTLNSDFQYNRRMLRLMFRSAPEPGD